jgi:hypothetical protein
MAPRQTGNQSPECRTSSARHFIPHWTISMRFGPRLARGLSIVLGLGLLVTALLHGSGLTQVRAAVANTSADLEALFPALWLAFAVHYLVLGALVLVATGPANGLSWRLLGHRRRSAADGCPASGHLFRLHPTHSHSAGRRSPRSGGRGRFPGVGPPGCLTGGF